MYVDVHTHLTHSKFADDCDKVIKDAIDAGLKAIVVNGLNPASNRQILNLAEKYNEVLPALGIYPVDAVNDLIGNLPFEVADFSVLEEIEFIRTKAHEGKVKAIGECGLDGHWLQNDTYEAQETVFLSLMEIASDYDLPIIIHTRKREKRAIEILKHHGQKKVNFHCYGGKTKLAIQTAEEMGWYFSIPCNCRTNEAFTKLLRQLPTASILTETDAPYLAPIRGERNAPKNVVQTVAYLAELRDWSEVRARTIIWENFTTLFGSNAHH